METKTYSFSNGVTINGTAEQILKAAEAFGEKIDPVMLGIIPAGFYVSSDGELKEISKMHTQYIINALLKRTLEHFESIRIKKITDDSELPQFLVNYVNLTENPQIEALYTELTKRAATKKVGG